MHLTDDDGTIKPSCQESDYRPVLAQMELEWGVGVVAGLSGAVKGAREGGGIVR